MAWHEHKITSSDTIHLLAASSLERPSDNICFRVNTILAGSPKHKLYFTLSCTLTFAEFREVIKKQQVSVFIRDKDDQ